MKITRKSISDKIVELDSVKREREALDARIATLQSQIIDHLDSSEIKSLTVEDPDGRQIKVTKVQGIRTIIDEGSLKSKLGAKMWNKVSTQVLDKKKLEAHIATGDIDPLLVADCSTEQTNKPYVKLT